MAYSKASGKAVAKYDKKHYKMVTVKIPFDMFDDMQKCSSYENSGQFIKMLIDAEIKRECISDDMPDGERVRM